MLVEKLNALRAENDRESGFTLIELMIVVVIIGILAIIAFPIMYEHQRTAIQATMTSDVKNTLNNIAVYLVTDPTAEALEQEKVTPDGTPTGPGVGKYDVIVTDPNTTVKVDGAWNTYRIRAWNVDLDKDATDTEFGSYDVKYDSRTGKTVLGDAPWTTDLVNG